MDIINMKSFEEFKKSIELDEKINLLATLGDYEFCKDVTDDINLVKYKGKVISTGDYDSGADAWFMSIKGTKGQKAFEGDDGAISVLKYFKKNKITE
jgi:hypothetical protein